MKLIVLTTPGLETNELWLEVKQKLVDNGTEIIEWDAKDFENSWNETEQYTENLLAKEIIKSFGNTPARTDFDTLEKFLLKGFEIPVFEKAIHFTGFEEDNIKIGNSIVLDSESYKEHRNFWGKGASHTMLHSMEMSIADHQRKLLDTFFPIEDKEEFAKDFPNKDFRPDPRKQDERIIGTQNNFGSIGYPKADKKKQKAQRLARRNKR